MNMELPTYNMSSVNGDYMNTGSNYVPNIVPIQSSSPNYVRNYYEIEDRNSNDYPPIGQLVPVGDDYFLIVFIIAYTIIKTIKNYKIINNKN